MSYPPYQSGFPNPPNMGGNSNIGFSQQQDMGQSMYPSSGLGFPMPPNSAGSQGSQSLPYSLYPTTQPSVPSQQVQSSYSAPFPPQSGPNFDPFSSASNSTPYNPSGGNSAPYPPAVGSSAPYNPSGGSSAPYPPTGGSSTPYNPSGGFAPYNPSDRSSAPYPPNGGGSSAPYNPSMASSAPFPLPGMNPSPYPPTASGTPSAPYGASGAPTAPFPQSTGPNMTPYGSSNVMGSPYPPQGNTTSSLFGSPHPPPTGPVVHSIYPVASLHATSISGSSSHCPGSVCPYQERPTVRPAASFDPSGDAALLRKAMKGFGTDEAAIIQVLGRRTSYQRQQICQKYQQAYGREMVRDLKSELSGQFSVTVMALMTPIPIFLAREINYAISGMGTKENTLIEILCTNDNNTIRQIKIEYQKQFGRPLETDLKGDTSGDFGRLMVSMASASRDETGCDTSLAPKLAQSLYNSGAKKRGTNEAEFNRIMSSYSYPLLRCVFHEYVKVSGGKTFEKAIKSELSGDFRDGMLAMYECINNRAAYYARCLKDAMRGMGTNDKALVRIVVTRCEIDMGNIKDEYKKAYGKRLEDIIANETSGDYKKILLALIQG